MPTGHPKREVHEGVGNRAVDKCQDWPVHTVVEVLGTGRSLRWNVGKRKEALISSSWNDRFRGFLH